MVVGRGMVRDIRWMHQNFRAKLSQFLPSHQRYVWSSVVVMEDNAFLIDQFWPFFFNRLLQSHWLLTVESRINGLARFEQLMMNNSFPSPPNTQHHLPWRQYGLCNRLWSFSELRPRSFSYIIVVRDPLFITRNHSFQKWLDFVLFQQRFTNGNSAY